MLVLVRMFLCVRVNVLSVRVRMFAFACARMRVCASVFVVRLRLFECVSVCACVL